MIPGIDGVACRFASGILRVGALDGQVATIYRNRHTWDKIRRLMKLTMPRSGLLITCFVIAVLPSLGCSSVYTVSMNAEEIQRRLQEKLPVERTKLLLKTTVTDVQVRLQEGSDRIRLRPSLVLEVPLLGALPGQVSVDARVRYAPDRGEFFLDDAVVTDLDVPRIPDSQRDRAQRLVAMVAQAYFATTPVYRLKQGNFKHALAKLIIKSVTVRDGRLLITMGT